MVRHRRSVVSLNGPTDDLPSRRCQLEGKVRPASFRETIRRVPIQINDGDIGISRFHPEGMPEMVGDVLVAEDAAGENSIANRFGILSQRKAENADLLAERSLKTSHTSKEGLDGAKGRRDVADARRGRFGRSDDPSLCGIEIIHDPARTGPERESARDHSGANQRRSPKQHDAKSLGLVVLGACSLYVLLSLFIEINNTFHQS